MKKNNFKSLMQAAVLICTPLVIASCDDVFGDVDNPIPSHLTVSQAAVNLELHADRPDAATFIRKGIAATGAQLVYSSSDEKVATVDANGKITGVGEGECQIIVKATGLDSNGKQTYQEAEESFTVKVKDWRAQIKFAEVSAVVNSALIRRGDFKLKDSEVYPATGCTVAYTHAPVDGSTDPDPIDNTAAGKGIAADGTITLASNAGKAVITATISAVPDGYEMKSFGDGKKVEAKFTLEVKEGVVYFAGYDATGKEVRKAMLKGEGADEYINLSDKLMNAGKTAFLNTDVSLDAGWYYVDRSLSSFAHNIRVKGDVNFILNDDWPLNLGKDLMDESAKQNYKLNFYSQRKTAAKPEVGSAQFGVIKEFKDVNVCGANINASASAVENVTINNGAIKHLSGTGTGNVNITDGIAWNVEKFATLTLTKVDKKATVDVDYLTNIGTVTLSEGTSADGLKGITTLTVTKASVGYIGLSGDGKNVENVTIDKATSIGDLTNVGTAVITETPINNMTSVADLTLVKVKTTAARTLSKIGSVTINKSDETLTFTGIQANALNISDGTIVVGTTTANGQIAGFDSKGAAADTKVTMTGGKLTVNGPSGAIFAVLGDVEVSGGTFWACSPDHHAVSGALVGSFEGSTDNKTWTAITGAERPKYIQNKKSE